MAVVTNLPLLAANRPHLLAMLIVPVALVVRLKC